MRPVPNLFRSQTAANAPWYYELFLARLQLANRPTRVIQVCRAIRRFAAAQGDSRAGIFTYSWEMEAWERARKFNAMWRTLRAWERSVFRRTLDLERRRWKPSDTHQLLYFYAPLLYLMGRYRLGCRLLEAGLKMQSRREHWSFDSLWHVYKPVAKPSQRSQVTLAHFYRALGRDLRDWPLWPAFVDGFDARLFRLCGMSRRALRDDPALLRRFYDCIRRERRVRLFTGTTLGEADLVDSPAKVKKRQREVAARIKSHRDDPQRQKLYDLLDRLFPELANLPHSRA